MADSPDFGTFGRCEETPVDKMPPEMKDAYDFTTKLRGQVPGPHKIWLVNPTLSKTIVPTGKYHQVEYTLTKPEIEIVTNVINSRWLDTLDPAGEPEIVVTGRMGGDFCIDEDANVIYLATHRQNTIDVVSINPGLNSGFTQSVAGDPFSKDLVGPSGGVWARTGGDNGKVAFFIMDGGTASPPPDGPGPAKLLRVEFKPLGDALPGTTA